MSAASEVEYQSVDGEQHGPGMDDFGMSERDLFGEGGSIDPSEDGDEQQEAVAMEQDTDNEILRATNVHCSMLPGFKMEFLGEGVNESRVMLVAVSDGQTWRPFNNSFAGEEEGSTPPPIPKRVECLNVPMQVYARGAEEVAAWDAPSDPGQKSRSAAIAALMGLLFTGPQKHWVSGDHAEIEDEVRKRMEAGAEQTPGQIRKQVEEDMDGKIQSYTFRPCKQTGESQSMQSIRAPMFMILLEELYDPEMVHVVAHRYIKLVFDERHSDTKLVKKLIEENSNRLRHGGANSVPNDRRNKQHETCNMKQRTMADPAKINHFAATQHFNIHSLDSLCMMLKQYGGCTDDNNGGRPLLDIGALPLGTGYIEFTPHDTLGGTHPLSPEVVFNMRRHEALSAGLIGANGQPLRVCEAQLDPATYFDLSQQGRPVFCPSKQLRELEAVHICIKTSILSPFQAALPKQLNGGILPSDTLLFMFFEMNKTTDPAILKAKSVWQRTEHDAYEKRQADAEIAARNDHTERLRRRAGFEVHVALGNEDEEEMRAMDEEKLQNEIQAARSAVSHPRAFSWKGVRHLVTNLFVNYMKNEDQHAIQLHNQLREVSLFTRDMQDMTPEQLASKRNGWKVYDDSINDGSIGLETRCPLKDVSEEVTRGYRVVCQWRDHVTRSTEIKYARDADTRKVKLDTIHKKFLTGVHDLISMGLSQFENCFISQTTSDKIPAGWRDIYKGLMNEIRDVPSFAKNASDIPFTCRAVDPKDIDCSKGTANIAFAYGMQRVAKDLTISGEWRAKLDDLFSDGVEIEGRYVQHMHDLYRHAFEVAQPVSYIRLFCGDAGTGKSMRGERLQSLMIPGWLMNSGQASAKSGMNAEEGGDYTNGRLLLYDEVMEELKGNDSGRLEYMKQITMMNKVASTRTVPVDDGHNGKHYKTAHHVTRHDETMACFTNTGQTAFASNETMSSNRIPMTQRIVAGVVLPEGSKSASDANYKSKMKEDPKMAALVNQLRVVSGLTFLSMLFFKHISFLQPDSTACDAIWDDLDKMLWEQFKIPQPCQRKKTKRRMTWEMMVTESAVLKKFYYSCTAFGFPDMRPDAQTTSIPAWNIQQLCDVFSLMSADVENIVEAWAASLNDSPASSEALFHVKNMIANAHGGTIGHARDALLPSNQQFTMSQYLRPAFNDKFIGDWETQSSLPEHKGKIETVIANGMAVDEMVQLGASYRRVRELKSVAESRLRLFPPPVSTRRTTETIRLLLTDIHPTEDDPAVCQLANGSEERVEAILQACKPTFDDALNSGYAEDNLLSWLNGGSVPMRDTSWSACLSHPHIGTSNKSWGFRMYYPEESQRQARCYDFCWRRMEEKVGAEESQPGSGGADKSKSDPWLPFAKKINVASNKMFPLSEAVVRDSLVLMGHADQWSQTVIASKMTFLPEGKKPNDAFVAEAEQVTDRKSLAAHMGVVLEKVAYVSISDGSERVRNDAWRRSFVRGYLDRCGIWQPEDPNNPDTLTSEIDATRQKPVYRLSEDGEVRFAHSSESRSYLGITSSPETDVYDRRLQTLVHECRLPALIGASPLFAHLELGSPIRIANDNGKTVFDVNSMFVVDQVKLFTEMALTISSIPGILGMPVDVKHATTKNLRASGKRDEEKKRSLESEGSSSVDASVANGSANSSSMPESGSDTVAKEPRTTKEKIKELACCFDISTIFWQQLAYERFGLDIQHQLEATVRAFPECFKKELEETNGDIEEAVKLVVKWLPEYTFRSCGFGKEQLFPLTHKMSIGPSKHILLAGKTTGGDSIDEDRLASTLSLRYGRNISKDSKEFAAERRPNALKLIPDDANLYNHSSISAFGIVSLQRRGLLGKTNDFRFGMVSDKGLELASYVTHTLAAEQVRGFDLFMPCHSALGRKTFRGIAATQAVSDANKKEVARRVEQEALSVHNDTLAAIEAQKTIDFTSSLPRPSQAAGSSSQQMDEGEEVRVEDV